MGINKKLLNICMICLIIYLISKSSGLWINIIYLFKKIFYPLLFSFFLAYAFYPIISFFKNKIIGIIFIIIFFIGIISFFFFFIMPKIINDLYNLFNGSIVFIEYLNKKYNFNIKQIENLLFSNFNLIVNNISLIPNIFNKIASIISIVFISFSFFIYLLLDMENIKKYTSKLIKNKSSNLFNLIIQIDKELKEYFKSFIKIMGITLVEYTSGFALIGHPNYLLLGFCAAISSFIPYFGGIIINGIALLMAFTVSKSLFIKTMVLFFILSLIDSYIINPYVYGKTNKIHPIISIFAFFASSILFGVVGMIISMPVTIIIITIFKYFKEVNYDSKT